jgi:D-alanine-D-alanine ligase-like ATP-grasp enzyme
VLDDIEAALPYPLFTKPARQGSSIGIKPVPSREELVAGIEEAFGYDRVAIVEEGLDRRPRDRVRGARQRRVEVTRPGETVHRADFYDFEAKYIAPVELRCPADLPADVAAALTMRYAREAYLAIGCRGMARVDFFYVEAHRRGARQRDQHDPRVHPAVDVLGGVGGRGRSATGRSSTGCSTSRWRRPETEARYAP